MKSFINISDNSNSDFRTKVPRMTPHDNAGMSDQACLCAGTGIKLARTKCSNLFFGSIACLEVTIGLI